MTAVPPPLSPSRRQAYMASPTRSSPLRESFTFTSQTSPKPSKRVPASPVPSKSSILSDSTKGWTSPLKIQKRPSPVVSQGFDDDVFSGEENTGPPLEEAFARPRMTSNSFKQLNRGLVSNSIFKQGATNNASSPPPQPSPRASRFQSSFSPSAGMTESSSTESISSLASSNVSFKNSSTALGLGHANVRASPSTSRKMSNERQPKLPSTFTAPLPSPIDLPSPKQRDGDSFAQQRKSRQSVGALGSRSLISNSVFTSTSESSRPLSPVSSSEPISLPSSPVRPVAMAHSSSSSSLNSNNGGLLHSKRMKGPRTMSPPGSLNDLASFSAFEDEEKELSEFGGDQMTLSFSQRSRSKTVTFASGDEVREFEKAEYEDESRRESLSSEYSEGSSTISEDEAARESPRTVVELAHGLAAHTPSVEEMLEKFLHEDLVENQGQHAAALAAHRAGAALPSPPAEERLHHSNKTYTLESPARDSPRHSPVNENEGDGLGLAEYEAHEKKTVITSAHRPNLSSSGLPTLHDSTSTQDEAETPTRATFDFEPHNGDSASSSPTRQNSLARRPLPRLPPTPTGGSAPRSAHDSLSDSRGPWETEESNAEEVLDEPIDLPSRIPRLTRDASEFSIPEVDSFSPLIFDTSDYDRLTEEQEEKPRISPPLSQIPKPVSHSNLRASTVSMTGTIVSESGADLNRGDSLASSVAGSINGKRQFITREKMEAKMKAKMAHALAVETPSSQPQAAPQPAAAQAQLSAPDRLDFSSSSLSGKSPEALQAMKSPLERFKFASNPDVSSEDEDDYFGTASPATLHARDDSPVIPSSAPAPPPKEALADHEAKLLEARRKARAAKNGLEAPAPSKGRRRSLSTGDASPTLEQKANDTQLVIVPPTPLLNAQTHRLPSLMQSPAPKFAEQLGGAIDQIIENKDRSYRLREHRVTASDIPEQTSAGDLLSTAPAKSWKKVRKASDMNQYKEQLRQYRESESQLPEKRLFMKITHISLPNLPIPRQKTYCNIILDTKQQRVESELMPLNREMAVEQVEWELMSLDGLTFNLALQVDLKSKYNRHLMPPASAPLPESQTSKPKAGLRSKIFGMKPRPASVIQQPSAPASDPLLYQLNMEGVVGDTNLVYADVEKKSTGQRHRIALPVRSARGQLIGEMKLDIFTLPAISGVPGSELPESLVDCVKGLEKLGQSNFRHIEGSLTQLGADCTTWRRRKVVAQGDKLVTYNEITKATQAAMDLSLVTEVEDCNAGPVEASSPIAASERTTSSQTAKRSSRSGKSDHTQRASDEEEHYHVERTFALHFEDGSVVQFFSDSDEEKNRWLDCLPKIIGKSANKPPLWATALNQQIAIQKSASSTKMEPSASTASSARSSKRVAPPVVASTSTAPLAATRRPSSSQLPRKMSSTNLSSITASTGPSKRPPSAIENRPIPAAQASVSSRPASAHGSVSTITGKPPRPDRPPSRQMETQPSSSGSSAVSSNRYVTDGSVARYAKDASRQIGGPQRRRP